jgi:hypothetical protein
MIRCAGRHQGDAEPLEVVAARELHREVVRERSRLSIRMVRTPSPAMAATMA